MHDGEFVWEDYNIPFPKPEAGRFERDSRINCYDVNAQIYLDFATALDNDGWIQYYGSREREYQNRRSISSMMFAKDNQILRLEYMYDDHFIIEYESGDEDPQGASAVTRVEALPLIRQAMEAQPRYLSAGIVEEEAAAEVLLEMYIPRLFGNANMQLFTAYGNAADDREGRLGFFIVSNGKALRIFDRVDSSVVVDVDSDGIFELVTFHIEDSPGINSTRVRAYKYGPPPREDSPAIHIAYETVLDSQKLHYIVDGEYLKMYLNLSLLHVHLWVYGVSRRSDGVVMANLGRLIFKDGEMFPENMEEYDITFDEGLIDPFDPPADWLISPSPPPAP
ncbi:MAG: hypothetical protein LBR85_06015 [Oscillospiraceae bacterium]|jgi:hypothetical protein|nr:hypothetical protein [Oscillospiraceae bacterium]